MIGMQSPKTRASTPRSTHPPSRRSSRQVVVVEDPQTPRMRHGHADRRAVAPRKVRRDEPGHEASVVTILPARRTL